MKYRHYYCAPKPEMNGDGYYGTISGMKNASLIEASTITEFEEKFHRIVDEYIKEVEEIKGRRRRRAAVWSVILAVLFVGMTATCPNKQKHSDALKDLISSLLNNEATSSDADGWKYLGVMLGNRLICAVIDNSLYVENYFLFSIGKMSFDREDSIVSIGIFNHVFTKSREDVKRAVDDNPELRKALDELF